MPDSSASLTRATPRASQAAASVVGFKGSSGSTMRSTLAASLQLRNGKVAAHADAQTGAKLPAMRSEQEPIAAWIATTLNAKGWTAYRWAKETKGKVHATTIMRALSPDAKSVTGLAKIRALAEAAGVPMPAFLPPSENLFSAELLKEVLPTVLLAMGCPIPDSDDLMLGARLLQRALEFVEANPEVADDPSRVRFAMLALAGPGAHQA